MLAWPRVAGKERTLVQWPVSPSHRVGRQPGSGESGSGWCRITAGQEDETVVVRDAGFMQSRVAGEDEAALAGGQELAVVGGEAAGDPAVPASFPALTVP